MSSNEDEEAEKLLEGMIFTKNIKIENGKLLLLGRPGVIFNADIIASLFKPLLDLDPNILFKSGYEAIGTVSDDYKARFNDQQSELDFIRKISKVMGVGKIDISIQKDKVIVNIYPSTFAESYAKLYGNSNRPVCYFASGVLSRLLSVILNKDLHFEEVSCEAKGDSKCVFTADIH